MTDFKAGDKVRVANIYGGTSDNRVGAEGTIKTVRGGGTAFYVKVESKGHSRFGDELIFYPSELELVKPVPKFKVGDYVTVTGKGLSRIGKQGTVVSLNAPYNDWPVVVEFPDGVRFTYGTDELVKATSYFLGFAPGGATKLYDYAAADLRLTAKVVGDFSKPVDNVNDPSHYGGKDNPFEVIKVAEAWGFNENAYLFNALKYLARAGKKGSKVEDLKKLQFYVAREIRREEAK